MDGRRVFDAVSWLLERKSSTKMQIATDRGQDILPIK